MRRRSSARDRGSPQPEGEGRKKSSAVRWRASTVRSPKRSLASSSRWTRLPPDRAEETNTRAFWVWGA